MGRSQLLPGSSCRSGPTTSSICATVQAERLLRLSGQPSSCARPCPRRRVAPLDVVQAMHRMSSAAMSPRSPPPPSQATRAISPTAWARHQTLHADPTHHLGLCLWQSRHDGDREECHRSNLVEILVYRRSPRGGVEGRLILEDSTIISMGADIQRPAARSASARIVASANVVWSPPTVGFAGRAVPRQLARTRNMRCRHRQERLGRGELCPPARLRHR